MGQSHVLIQGRVGGLEAGLVAGCAETAVERALPGGEVSVA